ncbi:hypothetical protein BCR33DRAFT_850492 [Rhizoclosmatium globosum]|uniref:Conserved oligomeric Golgi complex subunit 7 n=1 Tax=Rhizoclosmatium globosum TaxID=329046 RepID=A0A1Y2CBF9_9FUNG|nr:hypothetical protein BCR33DRAFT_850492 [Rhizoclosmatium globosum]|eukprot:ORY44369.1 hypothetical protein BCR33DRAFT_850492 [Rhizoclosmatium globosum]
MDIKARAKQWANERIALALAQKQEQVKEKDEAVSFLVTSTSLACASAAANLDRLCDDAALTLPRAAADLDFLRRDLANLRDSVEFNNNNNKTRTNDAFDGLLLLDTIRSRMQLAREALQEAENWNSLTTELETIFAAQDYSKAGLRLAEASAPSRSLLHSLQNQLETAVGPALMDAFKSHDLEKVKEYRLVFDQIQRSPEFIAYYFKTAKAPLLSYWKKLNDEIDMEDASGFLKGLQLFFDQFLVVFRQELSWSEHLFSGNSAANMIKLVHQTFNSLKPSVSVSWCINVEHELVPLIAAAAAPKKELSSTPSTAQIVSKKPSSLQIGSSATPAATVVAKVDLSTWAFPILETFSPYHQTYQSLELAHLVSCIPSLFTSSRVVTTSTAAARIAATVDALMDPVIPAVFRTVETSTLRSIDFTAGFGAEGQVSAVDSFLANVVERMEGVVGKLTALGTGDLSASAAALNEVVNFKSNKPGDLTPEDGDEFGLQGRMEDGQEWVVFELGLRYLAAIKLVQEGVTAQETPSEPPSPTKPAVPVPGATSLIKTLSSLTTKTQTTLFNLIFTPISRHITPVPTLPAWSLDKDPSAPSDATSDIPRFSLSPSVFITRVGEALLTLPQRFDMHMSNDASAVLYGMQSLPHLKPDDFSLDGEDAALELEDLIHLWITAVARSAMSLLVAKVLEIGKLGKFGARQLATDVDYIIKVVEAMDVDVLEDLVGVSEGLDGEGGVAVEGEGDVVEGKVVVARKVAKLCGVQE